MIASLTGHRPNKLGNEYDMRGPYSLFIARRLKAWLKKHRPEKIISGMALGADQIWAVCGIRQKIPVVAAIPFKGQEKIWPPLSQANYISLLRHELVIPKIICKGGYAAYKMQLRNQWMVDSSEVLVAIWDGSDGGTANCVEYARSKNKEVVVIKPEAY